MLFPTLFWYSKIVVIDAKMIFFLLFFKDQEKKSFATPWELLRNDGLETDKTGVRHFPCDFALVGLLLHFFVVVVP